MTQHDKTENVSIHVSLNQSSSLENKCCLRSWCVDFTDCVKVSWLLVNLRKWSHEMNHVRKYTRGVCCKWVWYQSRCLRFPGREGQREDCPGNYCIMYHICAHVHFNACLLTSCSGESCSMSVRRHLRPGRKWLTITSSEMTVEEVKEENYMRVCV